MRVVGIDPSMSATGVAHDDGGLTTITYPKQVTRDSRLGVLHTKVWDAAEGADLVVIEDLPTHAHGAGITGMVQGVVRLTLIHGAVPYLVVTPATVKKFATGKGNATKADMRMAWFQRTGDDVRDDNQVDAAWLRQLGLHHLGLPEFSLPKAQVAAIATAKPGWDYPPIKRTLHLPRAL